MTAGGHEPVSAGESSRLSQLFGIPLADDLATASAHPIVKWAGGKTRLLAELVARMPRTQVARYFEPFAGGAALFFRLAPARAVLGDANSDLISMYDAIATSVDEVIVVLESHRGAHVARGEAYYYEIRQAWNEQAHGAVADPRIIPSLHAVTTPIERAAAFIYLNKTCFNGLWRVTRKGRFNVPAGRQTNPSIYSPPALRAASLVLASAERRRGDYRIVVDDAVAGDFVYLDPPYDVVASGSNFTNYTASPFASQQQRELRDTARALVRRGVRVMISSSDTPAIRALYAGFRIDVVQRSGSMNSNPSKRQAVDELIICGGY